MSRSNVLNTNHMPTHDLLSDDIGNVCYIFHYFKIICYSVSVPSVASIFVSTPEVEKD